MASMSREFESSEYVPLAIQRAREIIGAWHSAYLPQLIACGLINIEVEAGEEPQTLAVAYSLRSGIVVNMVIEEDFEEAPDLLAVLQSNPSLLESLGRAIGPGGVKIGEMQSGAVKDLVALVEAQIDSDPQHAAKVLLEVMASEIDTALLSTAAVLRNKPLGGAIRTEVPATGAETLDGGQDVIFYAANGTAIARLGLRIVPRRSTPDDGAYGTHDYIVNLSTLMSVKFESLAPDAKARSAMERQILPLLTDSSPRELIPAIATAAVESLEGPVARAYSWIKNQTKPPRSGPSR